MPPKKQAATAEPKTEGEEQESTTDPDETSPPEGETQEQRGDGTPDPLAGFTAEQLREHPLFEEASADLTAAQKEEREKAYREGQSAGAKQADVQTKEYVANKEAAETFDRLEQKRVSQDPDDLQEYANAMGDPRTEEAYKRGKGLRQGPSREQVENELIGVIMGGVDSALDERLAKQGTLSDEEKARVDHGKFKTLGDLTVAKIDLVIERGTDAKVIKENAQKLLDAKDEGRHEAYDEMGLDYPAERIEGTKPAPPGTAAEYRQQYAEGDIDTPEYKRKMEAIGAKP